MDIDIDDALRHFQPLLDRAHAGEEFVISRAGRPLARLIGPASAAVERRAGRVKGHCGEAFDEALPRSELDAWDAAASETRE